MASLDGMRTEEGKLISYAWPGGYPVFYLDNECNCLCPNCANEQEDENSEPDAIVVWTIEACDINYEDPNLYCDHCNQRIESAYAEEDDDEEEEGTESAIEGEQIYVK
jgi:hypothetical protein